jgi:hypothetical protein
MKTSNAISVRYALKTAFRPRLINLDDAMVLDVFYADARIVEWVQVTDVSCYITSEKAMMTGANVKKTPLRRWLNCDLRGK